ncbi:MAG: YqeG family HAD IIIA-type phosphatase [Bacilli bacterium]|nr:YqeG family HAD IIIA-type phosphatase [Bacilli bacterium]
MIEIFRPDMYQKSIYDIDYKNLKKSGIKCVCFDLDNTLAPLNITVPDRDLLDFFYRLEEMEIKAIILSNSGKSRVAPFKEKCNVDSSFHSMKPFNKKYKKIMDMYHLKDTEIACVGDQLLTDILGANKMGFVSILVNPIGKKERFLTYFNRLVEKFIFKRLKKRGLFEKGVYYE